MFHRVALSLLLAAGCLSIQDAVGQTSARPSGPMRLTPRDQAGEAVPSLPTPPATTTTTTSVAPVPNTPTIAPTAPAPPVPAPPATAGQPLQLRPQGAASPPLQPVAPGGATVPPPAGTATDLKGLVLQQLGIPGGTTAGLATPGAVLPDRMIGGGSTPLPPAVSALPRKAPAPGQRRTAPVPATPDPSGPGGTAAGSQPGTPQGGKPTGETQSLARDRRRFEPHVFQRTQPRLPMAPARKDFEFAKPAQPRYPLDTSTLYRSDN